MNKWMRLGTRLSLPMVFLALVGCAGYRLGSTPPPGVKSISVLTFANKSNEPQVETEATRATLQELQKDGGLEVTTAEKADALLEVTITKYALTPLRYQRGSARTTQEYRLKVTAKVVCKRAGTGEVLVDRTVSGESTFELLGDMALAKRNALPEAARDLAHDIVESVVEYW